MKRTNNLSILLAVWLLGVPFLWGQSGNSGTIVGRVTDPSSAIVPGVDIVAVNVATGVSRSALSNENGDYRIEFLLPGDYTVTAEIAGFKKMNLTGILLQAGQVVRADVRMEIGQMTDSITVSGTATGVKTESAMLGETIDSVKIENLPLNGREFIALAALVPGAQAGSTRRGTISSYGYAIGFNGARSSYNAYQVDGAENTDTNSNRLMSSPSLDAIREFSVLTNMYSAQYGRSGGAVISAVTKSGTNAFHGTLFEYHRNKALDALPYFGSAAGRQNTPPYLYHQFGGAVGGPVFKNKTFFFFSTEFFRQKAVGLNVVTFTPTAKEAQGDFSDTLNPWSADPTKLEKVKLINPYTQQPIGSSIWPASLISPKGRALMDIWSQYKPNKFDDPFLNLRITRGAGNDRAKYLTRIDHNFNKRHILSGTFNYGNYNYDSLGYTTHGDLQRFTNDRTLVLGYTTVFSPMLVNDLKFDHTLFADGRDYKIKDQNLAKDWGYWTGDMVTRLPAAPANRITTVSQIRFDLGNTGGRIFDEYHLSFKDNLVWTKGKHTLMFGGDFKHQYHGWLFDEPGPSGMFYWGLLDGFAALSTRYGSTGSVFSSVLNFLCDYQVYGFSNGLNLDLSRNMSAFWAEDTWKITPKLTLNLGLRHDYLAPFSETNGQIATLNFQTGKLTFPNNAPKDKLALVKYPYDLGGPDRPYEPNKKDFSPRFGLAFRPFDNNRTVVRGGYGMFYALDNASTTTFGSWVVPFAGNYPYQPQGVYFKDKQSRFQPLDKKPLDLELFAGTTPGFLRVNPPYYPTTYMQQWNVSIEREVASKLVAEIAWVGSKGTNLNGIQSTVAYDPELNRKLRALIPANFTNDIWAKGHNSKYHSLQMKLRKDFSSGFSFLNSFTWGHAMAESSNDEVSENTLTNVDANTLAYSSPKVYSNADFDVRKRFSSSGAYELPFGRGKHWGQNWHGLMDGFLGGWQTHWIMTLQDGYYYSIFVTQNRRPDRICDGNLPPGERTIGKWIDYTCFPAHPSRFVTNPVTGGQVEVDVQGNTGPNVLAGPGLNNFDLGIQKNFTVKEDIRVQLRMEAFNLLNRPNFDVGAGAQGNSFFNSASGSRITAAREMRDIQVAVKIIF